MFFVPFSTYLGDQADLWLLRAIAKQRLKDFPGAVADLDEAKIHLHDKRRGSNHEVLAARLSVVTSTSTRQKVMHGRLCLMRRRCFLKDNLDSGEFGFCHFFA